MSKLVRLYVGGARKNVPRMFLYVGGARKKISKGYIYVGGARKQFYASNLGEFSMLAGNSGDNSNHGYNRVLVSYGTLTPTSAQFRGVSVQQMRINNSGFFMLDLAQQGLGQSFFTSITIDGGIGTWTSASANYATDATGSRWTWNGATPFVGGITYQITIN